MINMPQLCFRQHILTYAPSERCFSGKVPKSSTQLRCQYCSHDHVAVALCPTEYVCSLLEATLASSSKSGWAHGPFTAAFVHAKCSLWSLINYDISFTNSEINETLLWTAYPDHSCDYFRTYMLPVDIFLYIMYQDISLRRLCCYCIRLLTRCNPVGPRTIGELSCQLLALPSKW